MKARNLINVAMLATGLIGASAANAASTNPLQPDYFWSRVNVETPVSANARFIEPTNPLQPNYYAAKAGDTAFVATATTTVPYVDARNPLHPSFNRI